MAVRAARRLVCVLGVLMLGACETLTREVLYHPDRTRVAPEEVGLHNLREEVFRAEDGTALIAWRSLGENAPSGAGAGGPFVLYLHGNASNLANRADFFRLFTEAGFGFAALSYRSFSGSEGRPSEAANIADALAYFDHLLALGVPADQIVLYGESLGSGVATQLAARRPVAGLILHAPYDAIDDLAAAKAPFLFPRRVLTDRYRSIDVIGDVTAPILWLHGARDRVVPLVHGARLFDAAPEGAKRRCLVPDADHFGLYTDALFAKATAPFIRSVTQRPPLSPPAPRC